MKGEDKCFKILTPFKLLKHNINNGKVKRTKVVDLLKSTTYGSIVNVKGWVRTHRGNKAVDFIALNDGSTNNNIQIVVDPSKVDENQLRQITTGACISAIGTLVESQGCRTEC